MSLFKGSSRCKLLPSSEGQQTSACSSRRQYCSEKEREKEGESSLAHSLFYHSHLHSLNSYQFPVVKTHPKWESHSSSFLVFQNREEKEKEKAEERKLKEQRKERKKTLPLLLFNSLLDISFYWDLAQVLKWPRHPQPSKGWTFPFLGRIEPRF